MQAGEAPWNTINASAVSDEQVAATTLPPGFVDKLTGAPVVLLVFVDLAVVASFDSGLDRIGVISGGSIYPFRLEYSAGRPKRRLGRYYPTTFVGAQEPALHELLGVPSQYAFAAMIPMGKPVKQLTKLCRVSRCLSLRHWNVLMDLRLKASAVQDLNPRGFRCRLGSLGVLLTFALHGRPPSVLIPLEMSA